ncbi:MAG TPA: GDSL-type esterase/lipase family protein [Anaerolineales bacterium]|nr:GDSL-type esterase/lipase family protein [Anaerolineales bacterium]
MPRQNRWVLVLVLELAALVLLIGLARALLRAPSWLATSPPTPFLFSTLTLTSTPSTPTTPTATATPTPAALATYVVAAGDTLWDIAVRFEIDLARLIVANPGINPEAVVPGQVLRIPPTARPVDATAEAEVGTAARVPQVGGGLRLYRSPGLAEELLAVVEPGTPVTIVGRTADSAWLEGDTPAGLHGWFQRGFVELFIDPSGVPVTGQISPESATAEAGERPIPTPLPTQQWPDSYPFVHNIGPHMQEIFTLGQSLGNRPAVFSKVGDSITASPVFLTPIGRGRYNLRDYFYLAPVIDTFLQEAARTDNSFANSSLAARGGWTSWSLLSSKEADPTQCLEGEIPLVCEYRRVRPAFAIIMLGTNDVLQTSPADYEANMRSILETTMNMGVVPILSSIPSLDRADVGGRVEALNTVLYNLALEYELPYLDYWAALVSLPHRGLSSDGVHPSVGPASADFTASNLQFGMTVRNLTALEALDAVWRYVTH